MYYTTLLLFLKFQTNYPYSPKYPYDAVLRVEHNFTEFIRVEIGGGAGFGQNKVATLAHFKAIEASQVICDTLYILEPSMGQSK